MDLSQHASGARASGFSAGQSCAKFKDNGGKGKKGKKGKKDGKKR